MINVTSYLVALVTFVAADMFWLGIMAPRLYRPTLGNIALPSVTLPAAMAFYAVYPVGVVIFVINPALKADSFSSAILYGALLQSPPKGPLRSGSPSINEAAHTV